MASPPSCSSSFVHVDPSMLPPNRVQYVDRSIITRDMACSICHREFTDEQGHIDQRVMSTFCDCIQQNRLFHSLCLSFYAFSAPNSRLEGGGIRRFDCPSARHRIDEGVLAEQRELFFQSTNDTFATACSRPGSPTSAASDAGDDEENWLDMHQAQKVQDVADMYRYFGSTRPEEELPPKQREMYEMYRGFGHEPGNPHRRNWEEGLRREIEAKANRGPECDEDECIRAALAACLAADLDVSLESEGNSVDEAHVDTDAEEPDELLVDDAQGYTLWNFLPRTFGNLMGYVRNLRFW